MVLFSLALLMREVKLIWKFTPASSEENNVDNNEPKSYFSGDPEASNFVEHQPLDNVKIEQTPGLVLELTLKVLKPGELFIHGIEYKLKALFPQSESTDYTIKGKQALKVYYNFTEFHILTGQSSQYVPEYCPSSVSIHLHLPHSQVP